MSASSSAGESDQIGRVPRSKDCRNLFDRDPCFYLAAFLGDFIPAISFRRGPKKQLIRETSATPNDVPRAPKMCPKMWVSPTPLECPIATGGPFPQATALLTAPSPSLFPTPASCCDAPGGGWARLVWGRGRRAQGAGGVLEGEGPPSGA